MALLAIAIALGIFVWILDHRGLKTREGPTERAYIVDLDRNDVTQLEIENGDTKIDLVKTERGWNLTAPVSDRADPKVVDTLLDSTQFLKRDDTITNLGKGEAKKNYLKQFGVLRSHLILRCTGKHTQIELQFGGETAVEGTSYVRVKGKEPVFATDDDLKNLISKSADSFRDHQLTPFLAPEINRIILNQTAGEIELTRQRDEWQIVRPIKARASNNAVNSLLEKISSMPVLQFQDEDGSADLDVENASNSISLFSDQSKVWIACGLPVPNQPGRIYVRVSDRPSTFIVDEGLAHALTQKPNDLRDRKIMRLNPDLIDRITITANGQPATRLIRRENRWVLASEQDAPADPEAINRFIRALNSNEVSRFVSDSATDLKQYGLDTPALEFAFSSYSSENTAEENAGETRLATLAVGNGQKDEYYARVEEEPYIVALNKRFVQQLPTSAFSFRSLDILTLQRSDLSSVEINKKGSTAVLARGANGQWVLQGATRVQNDTAIQSLLNTVAGLRAIAWVTDTNLASGTDLPEETIVIHTTNRANPDAITLNIGRANEQGDRYASISTQPGTFVVRSADFSTLQDSLER